MLDKGGRLEPARRSDSQASPPQLQWLIVALLFLSQTCGLCESLKEGETDLKPKLHSRERERAKE